MCVPKLTALTRFAENESGRLAADSTVSKAAEFSPETGTLPEFFEYQNCLKTVDQLALLAASDFGTVFVTKLFCE